MYVAPVAVRTADTVVVVVGGTVVVVTGGFVVVVAGGFVVVVVGLWCTVVVGCDGFFFVVRGVAPLAAVHTVVVVTA